MRNRRRAKRRNPYKPHDYDTFGHVVTPSLADQNKEMPASWAIQILSVVPSLSGALAMFLLSFKLARATRVSVTEVAAASLVAVVGAMSSLIIVKNHH